MGGNRYLPLTGVAAVVLIIAGLGAGGSTPNGRASEAKVVAFYGKHGTAQAVSGVLVSLGALMFLVFAATFSARLQRVRAEPSGASALCLVGAGVLAVGLAILAGLSITLDDVAGHVGGSALQTLNVMANDAVFIFIITIGTSAFLIGAATAVLTTGVLPRWLGWLAILLALVAAIPSHILGGTLDHIGFLGFAGLGVWTLIVGLLLTIRTTRPGGEVA
jgi:hypothetical protein